MPFTWSRRILALSGPILLLAMAAAGCGFRTGHSDGAAAPTGAFASEPVVIATGSPGTSASAEPSAAPTAGTPASVTSAPAGNPVPTPDLAAIDRLLTNLDADLGADASASTDEGSAP